MDEGNGDVALLVIAYTLIILVLLAAGQAMKYWREREKR